MNRRARQWLCELLLGEHTGSLEEALKLFIIRQVENQAIEDVLILEIAAA